MACHLICPADAIKKEPRVIGSISEAKAHGLTLVSGDLVPQQKESSPLINAMKRYIQTKKTDYNIMDTASGTHCSVIAALIGTDLALAVTEPTPLGAHDLELILKLAKELDIPGAIVLNKKGVASDKSIQKLSKKYDAPIIANLPYSPKIMETYCHGVPLEHKEVTALARILEGL